MPSNKVRDCLNFAWKICGANSQVGTDFGRSDLPRSLVDRVADCAEGKIAEFGFSVFAESIAKMPFKVCLDIYPDKHTIDYGQDIDGVNLYSELRCCRSRIDVKATRNYSQWLLIERHKFWADAYILVRACLPRDLEINMEKLKEIAGQDIKTEVMGFAYHFDLIDQVSKEPWFHFKKGDRLFTTDCLKDGISYPSPKELKKAIVGSIDNGGVKLIGAELKSAENFGYPVCLLRNSKAEWESFFEWIRFSSIKTNHPIDKRETMC